MRVRRLDTNGDIATSGIIWLYDRDAVAQTISTRLRLFLGEYFRNIQEGTPWFQDILGKPESLARVESVIKNRIIRTENVDRLLSFSTDYDISSRVYSVKAEVLTTYGVIDLDIGEGLING